MINLILAFLLILPAASAQANSGGGNNIYVLKNLKPINISQFNNANGTRHHLRFQNEQGSHSLIFSGLEASAKQPLLHAISGWNSYCTLEIECAAKAFCTGDCKNMYYELADDAAGNAEKKCKLRSYTCGPSLSEASPPTGKP